MCVCVFDRKVLVEIKIFLWDKGPEQILIFALTGIPHTFIIVSNRDFRFWKAEAGNDSQKY